MEKNKVMMIVIIVLLVVLLATIIGVFFYTLQILKANNEEVPADADSFELVQEMPKLTVEEVTTIDLSTPISTNLRTSDNGEEHIIKLNVGISFNNTDKKLSPILQELLEKNDSLNMDLVLGILRTKTYEELNQPDGDAILKEEILTKFRETYESNLIYSIVFSNIILQ